MDNGTLEFSLEAINSFILRLREVKDFYSWYLDEEGSIMGTFDYLNVTDSSPKDVMTIVAFPFRSEDRREFVDVLNFTWEEGEIIHDSSYNNVNCMFFSDKVRQLLLIELGL